MDLPPVQVVRTTLLPGRIIIMAELDALAWPMVVQDTLSTGTGDHSTMPV